MRILLTLAGVALLSLASPVDSARYRATNNELYSEIVAADLGIFGLEARRTAPVEEPVTDLVAEAQIAKIHVTCPANATITMDDHQTKQTGNKRLFTTPPLHRSGTYQLRAFVCTATGCFTEVKSVHVNPGEEVSVTILNAYASSSSNGACACGESCPCRGPAFGPAQAPIFFGGGGCGPFGCGGGGFPMMGGFGGGGCSSCGGGRCR